MWSWRRTSSSTRALIMVSCSPGRSPSTRAGAHPGGHLVLEGGDPDLVELVEQLREDGDELDPLEQRLPVVLGQVEQAGAEVEARLLPVGEALVPEGLDLLVGRRDGALDASASVAASASASAAPVTWISGGGAGCAGGWC